MCLNFDDLTIFFVEDTLEDTLDSVSLAQSADCTLSSEHVFLSSEHVFLSSLFLAFRFFLSFKIFGCRFLGSRLMLSS